MKLKFLFAALLGLAFSLGGWAQNQDNGGIKQDTKDAAHSTAKGTEKAYDKFRRFLALGIEVASGTNRWDARR